MKKTRTFQDDWLRSSEAALRDRVEAGSQPHVEAAGGIPHKEPGTVSSSLAWESGSEEEQVR